MDEGVNGFKVPVGNSELLAAAIEKLINNPELIKEMGANGRAKAETEFDVKEVIKSHLHIYSSVYN